jgi:hypothetical protein
MLLRKVVNKMADFNDFRELYGEFFTEIDGKEYINLENTKTILHNEIVKGNFKALQFLQFVLEVEKNMDK